jgi:hypothetical protein
VWQWTPETHPRHNAPGPGNRIRQGVELASSYTSRIRVDPAWLLQRVSFSAFCIASAKFCSNKADYTQFFPPVGKEVASPSHPFQLATLLAEKHGKSPRYLHSSHVFLDQLPHDASKTHIVDAPPASRARRQDHEETGASQKEEIWTESPE